MKNTITLGAALLLSTTAAYAGGLDRSGQGIGVLFEDGSVAELSYGMVMPSVTGSVGGGLATSGNVGQDYSQFGFGLKFDHSDTLSFALIMDQPFGANVAYDDTSVGYPAPLVGSAADLSSTAFTALARYKVNDSFSVHGGIRQVSTQATITDIGGAAGYSSTVESASALGYVVGAAFEKPEIALRVALTYSSATEFSNNTVVVPGVVEGPTEYTMPQSVNLDFQTGIAADTLLFGSIRWVDWTETSITPAFYPGGPLVSYDNDSTSYTLGVGRRFSDSFSGAVTVGYEAATGDAASNLAPTDGNLSIGLGGTYTMDNVEFTGGVRYVRLGDATTELVGADFSDNSAIGVGLKVAFSF